MFSLISFFAIPDMYMRALKEYQSTLSLLVNEIRMVSNRHQSYTNYSVTARNWKEDSVHLGYLN